MEKIKIICLTPVKDESWILDTFLKCASIWSDKIILADQDSKDDTLKIAEKYPKVKIIKNTSKLFEESERWKILIEEARKLPGKKLLVDLDADEIIVPDFRRTDKWKKILGSDPGTLFYFESLHILPDFRHYKIVRPVIPMMFIDNNEKFSGKTIHSPRLPITKELRRIFCKQIKIMHLTLIDPERFKSKIRWYQCWEKINGSLTKSQIYRKYNNFTKSWKK